MIKWIRAKLMSPDPELKITGHIFRYKDSEIVFRKFKEGIYPPFDCLELTESEALELHNWLGHVLYPECQHEWDGVLLEEPINGNLGLCKHCGEDCFVH